MEGGRKKVGKEVGEEVGKCIRNEMSWTGLAGWASWLAWAGWAGWTGWEHKSIDFRREGLKFTKIT